MHLDIVDISSHIIKPTPLKKPKAAYSINLGWRKYDSMEKITGVNIAKYLLVLWIEGE